MTYPYKPKSIEDWIDLMNRIDKMEKEIKFIKSLLKKNREKKRREKIDWAIAQFRYADKDEDQRKALSIIEQELGFK